MGISDIIEQFISEALKEEDYVQLQRNELASRFGCVPSQINYVIATRFTNERGYIVESRRGGGGGITIKKIAMQGTNPIMHIVNSIGDTIDYPTAKILVANLVGYDVISPKEAKLICSGITDKVIAVANPLRDALRARILKSMLVNLI
ncbi:MAG: CtsR family transcriptional regulator [Clostridia bacterium]|nr:CtsR family transcriptional regulator [Clostridia bacterium]